jgi:putative sterol carrier protein
MLRSKRSHLKEAMGKLAKEMQGLPGKGQLRLTCLAGDQWTSWTVSHQQKKATLQSSSRKSGKPTLEVITRLETARAMLAGELSPLSAFLQNRVRIRGDVDYGRLVLRHLAQRPGMCTDICN